VVFAVAQCLSNGVGANFGVGVGEARHERAESGGWSSWEGQPAPPHQLGDLRERCKLPQRGPGFTVVLLLFSIRFVPYYGE